ncbi:MAG: sulfur oxidation c-type cytochrome SoxA [Halothiobacillaceae bacterium]
MKTLLKITAAALAVGLTAPALHAADAAASAEAQAQEFRDFFFKRFPDIKPADYIYGVYALNADARAQFEAMNEFPPYDEAIAKGKAFYSKPLANGKSLKDCLGDAKGLRAKYPFFDTEAGKVRNLEADLIQCAQAYGETTFDEKSKDLKNVSAYLASESRGMKVHVTVPNEQALAAFEDGKRRWFQKTGQLNLSCADCHQYHSGQRARSETLSAGIGKTAHFPVWRLKDDGLVTLNDRLFGCVRDTRAKPYKRYGDEYRNMEYFLAYIDNGLEITGPAVRK